MYVMQPVTLILYITVLHVDSCMLYVRHVIDFVLGTSLTGSEYVYCKGNVYVVASSIGCDTELWLNSAP